MKDSRKRAPAVKIPQLEAFIAVAELGSFTEAAKSLSTSQSSISRRVAELEAILCRPLRISDGPFVLSPQGEEFLGLAQKIVAQLSAFRDTGRYSA